MKYISPDRSAVYYLSERLDGRLEGIRLGRTTGAYGFVSEGPLEDFRHPITSVVRDETPSPLPIDRNALPPLLATVLGPIAEEHPEVLDVIEGRLTIFEVLANV